MTASGPSGEQFFRALSAVEDDLTETDLAILRAQRRAPGKAMTARSCAAAIGSDSYRTGNLRYGAVAKRIGQAIPGYVPHVRSNGTPQWWAVLSTMTEKDPRGEWEWKMRPSLVAALDDALLSDGFAGTAYRVTPATTP